MWGDHTCAYNTCNNGRISVQIAPLRCRLAALRTDHADYSSGTVAEIFERRMNGESVISGSSIFFGAKGHMEKVEDSGKWPYSGIAKQLEIFPRAEYSVQYVHTE